MGMDTFGPFSTNPNCFIVQNIAPDKKQIRIFNYPINWMCDRDLLRIPGVAEGDIRSSLLKGEINHKIRAGEIRVLCSDIDLLQFNSTQKQFLQSAGVINGLQVDAGQLAVKRHEDIQLIGAVDDINTVFTIPSGVFIQNADYRIIVYKNGVKQFFLDDYFIAESGGPGSGYDTVIFTLPPTTIPIPVDVLTADYYTINS